MSEFTSVNLNITFDHASMSTAMADKREAARTVRAVQYLNRTEFSAQNHSATSLNYSYDVESQRAIVKVVDRATGSVLGQMPPDEVVRLAAEARKRGRAQGQCGGCDED
jgi:uncharacterized FlaG/YvyC family protein